MLKRLLHIYTTKGDRYYQPHINTYNSVLDAFSKSNSTKAPDKAREWLQFMWDAPHVSPDIISYNSVLNVYATRGDAVAAMKLVEEMKT